MGDGRCFGRAKERWSLSWTWLIVKSKGLFESVVVGLFQSVFYAEIHQNDVFLFLKNYFWDQHIKTIQNIQKKKLIFSKKNKFEFFGTAFPNVF